MSKKKSMNFIVPLVVYPFDVMISFGETDEKLKKELKGRVTDKVYDAEIENVEYRSTCRAFMYMFSSGQFLIRMKNVPESVEDFSILSHEIFHVVEALFKRIGIKHSTKSSEAWAYLIEWITKQAYIKILK